jgi:acetyl-CoA synthetase
LRNQWLTAKNFVSAFRFPFRFPTPTAPKGLLGRKALRDIAGGRQATGDTTTLEDFSVLSKLREEEEG